MPRHHDLERLDFIPELPFLSISPLQFILQFDELFGLPGVNLCPQAARLTLIHLNHLVKLLHLRTLLRQILEGPLKLLLDPILVLLLQDIDLGLSRLQLLFDLAVARALAPNLLLGLGEVSLLAPGQHLLQLSDPLICGMQLTLDNLAVGKPFPLGFLHLFAHPFVFVDPELRAVTEAANFLCTKLVRFFVDDRPGEPTPETRQVIRGLTRTMIRSKYQVSDVLRQLFLSRYFHDQTNHANVIKSPIQLIVQGIRTLGLPPRDLDSLLDASRLMGQELMQPPSVKGWDGGRSWINTATLFARQNLMVYLLTGRRPNGSNWAQNDVPYDASKLIAHLPAGDRQNPEAVTDYLLRLNLGTKPLVERREVLKAFMTETGNRVDNDRLVACLALITAMPEYQLC